MGIEVIFHRRGPGWIVVFGELVDLSTSLKSEGFFGGGHCDGDEREMG